MKPSTITKAALLITLAGSTTASAQLFPASFNLSSLNGANGFVINGIDASDFSGYSVSSAGDVNGDGFDDIIIGAYEADPGGRVNAGESYVVFGGIGVGSTGVIELSSLNGANGFVINGIDASDVSGRSVSSAGDVNGDGFDDLIIGADLADPNGYVLAGEGYVVFGGAGVGSTGVIELSALNGTNGFVLEGDDAGDRCGISVSAAGDVNGDGIDDLIIGARDAEDFTFRLGIGASYVVYGRAGLGSTGTIFLDALSTISGATLYGIDAYDFSGSSVSSAGDINGDGVDDLVIGAGEADPNGNGNAGESYVVFGRPTIHFTQLRFLNGSDGFVLNGVDANDFSGRSVSSAGDVNGDGVDDLIVGADGGDPNGNIDAGESYVVFGGVGVGSTGAIELSALDGSNGFVLRGINTADNSGASVSSAGDFNGDGIDDLIIGARSADPNGNSGAGESYVVFGGTGVGSTGIIELSSLNGANGFVLNGINEYDLSGRSVSSAGDVNGDGLDDLIIGAREADPNGNSNAGQSYVVFGMKDPSIPADLSGDGCVDSADLAILLAGWGGSGDADLDASGVVDSGDLAILLAAWSGC